MCKTYKFKLRLAQSAVNLALPAVDRFVAQLVVSCRGTRIGTKA